MLALAGALPALRALSLNTCTSITSASIAALAAQRPLLQEVQLSRCDKVRVWGGARVQGGGRGAEG